MDLHKAVFGAGTGRASRCPAEASQQKGQGGTFPNHRKTSPSRLEAGVLAAAVAAKEKMKELTSWLQLDSRLPVSPGALEHATLKKPDGPESMGMAGSLAASIL